MPRITGLDHLVLTVMDIKRTLAFYGDVLGMQADVFEAADGTLRTALHFGLQKVNLHQADGPFAPHAEVPMPGSADLCFLTDIPLMDWIAHLASHQVLIEEGPVARTGATGRINSIYVRDPDGNLIEIAVKV
ncbi:Catechol 2,3-dioxygenase [Cognatiyoonia koreensis]|uniref:Catechol 2,3-dioxygenase n=1 Tax=Cognatiyoonia koreensis TaxID=364200 RepID=A0A1I0REJ8_9RHOB|nr:VOC family protein [Cognatiyoonia koreensis]SEW38651.1 Catechol 2,3-dioxygenase [Cognatiyoonia koreensis]